MTAFQVSLMLLFLLGMITVSMFVIAWVLCDIAGYLKATVNLNNMLFKIAATEQIAEKFGTIVYEGEAGEGEKAAGEKVSGP